MGNNISKLIKKDALRYVPDIDMFAFDRPINDTSDFSGSCVHRTSFCNKTCYNVKLYDMYPAMKVKDNRSEMVWNNINIDTVQYVADSLARKRNQTTRARFMTRGEAIKDSSDIIRINDICNVTPTTLWWLPTRAWRHDVLRLLIEKQLFPIDNLVVLASLDPSNTMDDWETVNNWNKMFFGDDDMLHNPITEKPFFKCPKTWRGIKGHCSTCKAGCFAPKVLGRKVEVHLKSH